LYIDNQAGLRVRAKINSQIHSVEAPAWQGAKVQEYQAYSELSQRSQAGCIGAKNVKLLLREPLVGRPILLGRHLDVAWSGGIHQR